MSTTEQARLKKWDPEVEAGKVPRGKMLIFVYRQEPEVKKKKKKKKERKEKRLLFHKVSTSLSAFLTSPLSTHIRVNQS